jgi:hypothetical protein
MMIYTYPLSPNIIILSITFFLVDMIYKYNNKEESNLIYYNFIFIKVRIIKIKRKKLFLRINIYILFNYKAYKVV